MFTHIERKGIVSSIVEIATYELEKSMFTHVEMNGIVISIVEIET